ncbi:hypothetical protein M409DRAFT_25833 [Zasmidium cellare ATCC 36951]|uniref:Zn(2)-C6 fungal-type domain-containing protein n=1 Tax=Zasmidium cellare ATCC 36951 TaxID=1080233 RepID=A0A6A6C9E2_ZASCE|nr:uncharacterized protein M409DRAFT_25833 [Zasmidium cellare ATCC 36951]KAF2163645.1 hypothetical protein M409DRAFT_25833 [Zasmidium cellare ATCC 36951]
MSTGRPLLAARTSSGDASKDGGNTSPGGGRQPGGRPKRTLIESACSACRRRKSRCDGVRPTCSRCQNLRTDCHYEAEEGESRWSALRRRNQILEGERDQLRELMSFVQTRSEPEALNLFQRIRSSNYDDLFLLLRQTKDGTLGMSQNLVATTLPPPPASGEQRLPPIQTILDAPSSRGMTPIGLPQGHSLSSEDSRASSTSGPVSSHGHRVPLEPPIEPLLHQAHQVPHMISAPSLSSEESLGSMGSASMDGPRPLIDPELLPSDSSTPPYHHHRFNNESFSSASVPPPIYDSIAHGHGPVGGHQNQFQRLPRRSVHRLPFEDGRQPKMLKTCREDAQSPRRERPHVQLQELRDTS